MEKIENISWTNMLDSSNSEDSREYLNPKIVIEDCDKLIKKEVSAEIQIEFNSSENEKKFDKLVTEKKIKSPFKRHMSNEKVDITAKDIKEEHKVKMETENPYKRARKDSSESSSTGSSHREIETDQDTLERRQKQIDYGKNTIGYDCYIAKIPKEKRTREDPKTPPRQLKYSRRAWEGLIKAWRKKLHKYDPSSTVKENVD